MRTRILEPGAARARNPLSNLVTRLGAVLLAASLGVLAGGVAHAAPDGKALFDKTCAKCHGLDGKADTKAGKMVHAKPLLVKELAAPDGPDVVIKEVTENKKHKAVHEKVNDEELAAIAQYVHSLAVAGTK
jgi:mono/diheme cytochrome c family protein